MMRSVALLSTLLLAATAFSQNSLDPKFTAGTKATYKVTMNFQISGNSAVFASKLDYKVMESTESTIKHTFEWVEPHITIQEEEQSIPLTKIESTTNKFLVPATIVGGIEGSDQPRTFLAVQPILPEGELSADKENVRVIPKSEKLALDELTIKTKFVAEEEIDRVKAFKLDYNLSEKGTGFLVKGLVWVTKDGQILKVKTAFEELPVPAVGANSSGDITLEKLPK